MKLFSSKSKSQRTAEDKLVAAASGEIVSLSEVADEAFASGMLGEGYAVRPQSGEIFSPISGKVVMISDAGHAYSIKSENGIEVLVHIGLDTVELGGKAFSKKVAVGDEVECGELIAFADLDVIRSNGYDTVIPVLLTDGKSTSKANVVIGNAIGGKSTAMVF